MAENTVENSTVEILTQPKPEETALPTPLNIHEEERDPRLEPNPEQIREEKLRKKQLQLSDEINELRAKLNVKELELEHVKEQLGITAFDEFREGFNSSFKVFNDKWQLVKDSETYKKTGETLSKWKDSVVTSDKYIKTRETVEITGNKASSGLQTAGARTTDAIKKAGDTIRDNETIQHAWNRVRTATVSAKDNLVRSMSTTEDPASRPDQDEVVPDEPKPQPPPVQ